MPTKYCRHIRTNGHRCGSFALRGTPLCYFHTDSRQRHRSVRPQKAEPTFIHPINPQHGTRPMLVDHFSPLELELPALEDRESIQIALSMILSAIAQKRIEHKLARTLLYGLQVASANAATLKLEPLRVVSDIVTDEEGVRLARDEDPEEHILKQRLLKKYGRSVNVETQKE